jgi:hypothetical protein
MTPAMSMARSCPATEAGPWPKRAGLPFPRERIADNPGDHGQLYLFYDNPTPTGISRIADLLAKTPCRRDQRRGGPQCDDKEVRSAPEGAV